MAFGDEGRLLGERSISAGSLHVDEWRCNAADLADRNAIAVFPVGGWWKSFRDRARNNASMRYALILTIDAGDVEQDMWVETAIAAGVEIENEIERDIGPYGRLACGERVVKTGKTLGG